VPKRGRRKPTRIEARKFRGWERRQPDVKQEAGSPALARQSPERDASSTAPPQQQQQQSDVVLKGEPQSVNDSEVTVLHDLADEEENDESEQAVAKDEPHEETAVKGEHKEKEIAKGKFKERAIAKDEPSEEKAGKGDRKNREAEDGAFNNRGFLKRVASEGWGSKAASERGREGRSRQSASRVTENLRASSEETTEISHVSCRTRAAPNRQRARQEQQRGDLARVLSDSGGPEPAKGETERAKVNLARVVQDPARQGLQRAREEKT
jgi:hypothetical protein